MDKQIDKNTIYIFVPMSYKDPGEMYTHLHNAVLRGWEDSDECPHWKALDRGDENSEIMKRYRHDRYLLRYIADRFHGRESVEGEHRYRFRGNHFLLNDDKEAVRRRFDLPPADQPCVLIDSASSNPLSFFVKTVQLFTFDTGVFILAFRLVIDTDDPKAVGNAAFTLKKVSATQFYCGDKKNKHTLLEFAEGIGRNIYERAIETKPEHAGMRFRYFYFQKDGRARANVLTYLMMDSPGEKAFAENGKKIGLLQDDTCRRTLFFLRNCFSEQYTYYEDQEKGEEEEIYVHSDRALWGVTQEAAVCLVYPNYTKETDFYRGEFYQNLNSSYLLTYVLLLHQKYTLYLFLRNIGDFEHEENRDELRNYRDRLYRFETGYVFSHISEVPQYQGLYEKLFSNMKLEEMYQDVREPLAMLNKMEQEAEHEEREKQNARLTDAMFVLSILVIFSALTDGFELVEKFFGFGELGIGHWIGRLLLVLIVAALIATGFRGTGFINWVKDKWKQKK